MRDVLVIAANDLRQRVRDRTVLIFGLAVPLALMAVFNLVFNGVAGDIDIEPVTIATAVPPDDEAAAIVLDAIESVDAVEVTIAGDGGSYAGADDVRRAVRDGDAHLGLVIPEGFGLAITSGEGAVVEVTEGGGGLGSDIVVSTIDGVLDSIHAAAAAAVAAGEQGLPPDRVAAVATAVGNAAATGAGTIMLTEGQAATEQLSAEGSVVAGQAGLFLVFTVGFGVLALLADREMGTLTRIRSAPVPYGRVVAAKAVAGFTLGAGATAVLLAAGSVMFGVDFGALAAVAVVVAAAVAATTSLTFIVVRIARTAEQAQMAQSMLGMLLGIAGGAFFPIAATGLAGRLLDLNPVAALSHGLGITSGGGGLGDLGGVLAGLAVFAAIAALVSRLIPDRGAAG